MIKKEDYIVIHELHKKGYSNRRIGLLMGMDRRTIAKALSEPEYKPKKRVMSTTSKLDQYKEYIRSYINKSSDRIPYSVILEDIKQLGYQGGKTIVQDFLTAEYTKREIKKDDPVVRFETVSGKQMQVDWTTIRSGKNPIYAFVAVLGYSRYTFVHFVDNMLAETLISCHEKAFAFFKGVTQTILYDNMKAVVVQRDAYGKNQHKYHDQLKDLAKSCRFEIRLCRPYRAKTKGKVERFNSYLKGNFYRPLCINLQDTGLEITHEVLNSRIISWLHKANSRIHGTTKEKPVTRWVEEQKSLLPYGVVNNQVAVIVTNDTANNINMTPVTANKRMIDIPKTFVQPSDLYAYDQLLQGGARI
jgi:transposase